VVTVVFEKCCYGLFTTKCRKQFDIKKVVTFKVRTELAVSHYVGLGVTSYIPASITLCC